MNSALLSGAYSDGLTVFYIADRVGLCIFQCNKRYDHVTYDCIRQFFIVRNNILKQSGFNPEIIMSLFKCDAKNILTFLLRGNIVRVNLNDVVITLLFCF